MFKRKDNNEYKKSLIGSMILFPSDNNYSTSYLKYIENYKKNDKLNQLQKN
jgi:hypothetical protein